MQPPKQKKRQGVDDGWALRLTTLSISNVVVPELHPTLAVPAFAAIHWS
jgi:hypothetical protein